MPSRVSAPSAVAALVLVAPTAPSTTSSKRSSAPPQRQPQQPHMRGHASWRQLLPLHLLLLSIVARSALANPVSSPEIGSKAGKTTATSTSALKSSPQDAQLNSLTAYATNYDSISSANAQPNFKPSYRLPEMETNFTPIQSINSPAMANPTPVLMQYLPQPLQEGGVQYLQLIPTRPLIVPISPYLTSGAATAPVQPAFHPPLAAAANGNNNVVAEYAARGPTLLTALPGNANGAHSPAAPATTLVDLSGATPYGLPTYANAMQHAYRSNYRINREIKGKSFPGTLSLNMNEYIPGPQDGQQHSFVRGRP